MTPAGPIRAAALSVRGLTVSRGPDAVLTYPDFDLAPGTHLAVTGPSGTGKTTLLHVLAGLLIPDAGEVRYGGQSLGALTEAGRDAYRRRAVGYVFQDFHLMPGLSALENVELALRVSGVADPRDVARAALTRLDLGHRLRHRPAELSTGERQRVAIARAVAHNPGLLLVDEPTAHLDRERARVALDLLRGAAQQQGATLIVVTHDPLVAQDFGEQLHLNTAVTA
ncbi:putative ABC transport system ATP-binding protein [Deinococcus metalli]|uniref:ABC transporter ATP-binding protein n=1 Tax=Deinococcus metalli TaxID=1141878 RepID=A0A7W8KE23_9DEIO|nr:ABC transporter ATP-binding protein [Deinococcus metalli]MBB5376467.1 putative ABC transport system ATP-binding protein [Deinococcus metalli]GHF43819.1 ABC transporter ATP-binding protein [Deinococcus metalli]